MHAVGCLKSVFFFSLAISFFTVGCLQAEQNVLSLTSKEEALISHVKKSIESAEQEISKLDTSILAIQGMSSPVIRHFLNNVCSLESACYLEIGCWKGSTLVAATYKNENTLADVIAMDNWSEFDGPKNEFIHNVNSYVSAAPIRFYETDSFSVDKSQIFHQPVNIYFYDGDHSPEAQKKAFTFYNSVLDDVFIAFVDDWNWQQVREGTFAAFAELGYEVLYEKAFLTPANQATSSWWNGFYIAVIKKSDHFLPAYSKPTLRRVQGLRKGIIEYPVKYSERPLQ